MIAPLFMAGSRRSYVGKIVKRQFAAQPTPEGIRVINSWTGQIRAVASPLVMLCLMNLLIRR